MQLDEWQKKVLETPGNIFVRTGRQCGKSTVIVIKASEFILKNPNKFVLIIASVERQAEFLFEKILDYVSRKNKKMIKSGKDRPTKHKLQLTNGSLMLSLPTGVSGYGIRGYSPDLIIAEEAAYIHEEVWAAITPMLAVTKGALWLLSTPKGKLLPDGQETYFYSMSKDDSFTHFHIRSDECPRISKEFLERERKRMTKLQYAQEYEAIFLDDVMQFFPVELIKSCMKIKPSEPYSAVGTSFMGVDVARMGKDESVIISVDRIKKDRIRMYHMEILKKCLTTETTRRILFTDKIQNNKKIYIDDGGLGVAVFDPLLAENQTKRKVVAINNASRSLDREDKHRKKLLKEDLYSNLKRLMEQGSIELWISDELEMSLASIQYEIEDGGEMRIWGGYSHITEALIRACWSVCEKGLNIWAR